MGQSGNHQKNRDPCGGPCATLFAPMIKHILVSTFVAISASLVQAQDWRTADRSSAGLAPLPEKESRAVVQVYAARTLRWRKYFAVHSWIATKEAGASEYQT